MCSGPLNASANAMSEEPMVLDMMHCGVWIEKDWKYCPECGKRVHPL